jgi:hypothetical protein
MALNEPLTVVLPMHNSERQIRSAVHDILDLATSLHVPLDLVIVDDGSTDDTFESACELARTYPRIKVLRQPFRSGFASVLELVKNRLSIEMAIVHDGLSPIDPAELKRLILSEGNRRQGTITPETVESFDSHGSRRFTAMRSLQRSMETAHRAVLGFTWLRLEKPMLPRRRQTVEQSVPRTPILANLPTAGPLSNFSCESPGMAFPG